MQHNGIYFPLFRHLMKRQRSSIFVVYMNRNAELSIYYKRFLEVSNPKVIFNHVHTVQRNFGWIFALIWTELK